MGQRPWALGTLEHCALAPCTMDCDALGVLMLFIMASIFFFENQSVSEKQGKIPEKKDCGLLIRRLEVRAPALPSCHYCAIKQGP